jgi:tetratricopeptide (TPR) repeat protein
VPTYGKNPQLFPALFGLWGFYQVRGELPTARELAEQFLSLAQSVQDSTLLLIAHHMLGETFGAGLELPLVLAALAETHGKAGQVEEGLQALEEATAVMSKTGQRNYEAELYRTKGTLTFQSQASRGQVKTGQDKSEDTDPRCLTPDPEAEAEACFLQAIDIARKQQAKSLELRASMSLARLWQEQGKRHEVHELLSEIYGWFTEGFDTKDLQEAKALLEELA